MSYCYIMEKSIFLDTNALITLIQNEKIIEYQNSERVKFATFEKCLYEWKNGLKRYFIDPLLTLVLL